MALDLDYGEVIIMQTKPHWITYLLPSLWFLFGVALFMAAVVPNKYYNITFIIAISPLIYKYISNHFKTYAVTNHRVIYKRGILNRKEIILPSLNINNVFTNANFVQRLAGSANITISTGNDSNLDFHNVSNPYDFSSAISSIVIDESSRFDNYSDNFSNFKNFR